MVLHFKQLVLRSTQGKDNYICCVDNDTEFQKTSLEMTEMIDLWLKGLYSVDYKSSVLSRYYQGY